MKPTGIIRRVDDLGRIVIPKEIRRTLGIKENEPMEIFVDKNGTVVFKKYKESWEDVVLKWWETNYRTPIVAHSDFFHAGDYTFCVVHTSRIATVAGFAKRYTNDVHNATIGKVAAFARAIGKPINELVGWEG